MEDLDKRGTSHRLQARPRIITIWLGAYGPALEPCDLGDANAHFFRMHFEALQVNIFYPIVLLQEALMSTLGSEQPNVHGLAG